MDEKSSARKPSILDLFTYRPYREIVYKKTPETDLVISVSYPFDWEPSDARPGVLFFFGGGFRVGTRFQFARQTAYLASSGIVAATADYRVSEYHGTDHETCMVDAFSAMRWFRGHASELGVDAARIVAGGGSAGATLAAGLASLAGYDTPGEDSEISTRPDALVLFNPALGKRFPIVEGLRTGLPPTYMWFGTEDPLLEPAKVYIQKAESLGGTIDLDLAEGADHGFFNNGDHFSRSLERVDAFLATTGFTAS